LTTVLVAGALPGVAGAAGASIYTKVLDAYQAKGSIPPCQFTSTQLETAVKALGTAGGQYFGDFVEAIDSALATRASGGCSGQGHGAGGGAPGLGAGSTPPASNSGQPLPVGPLTAASGAGVPAPLLALAILAVALALLSATAVVVRRTGWDPAWADACRHSCREAGYRLAGGWSEFTDWLRSGVRD
jgi:hypothetical protein